MNPILIALVFLLGFIVWLLLAFAYKPIGKIINRLTSNARKAMLEEDITEEKGEN